jgi:hypothetical protein
MTPPPADPWGDWLKRNKVAVGIGVAVLALVALSDGGGTPAASSGDAPAPLAGDAPGGTIDMDEWRRRQRQDDREQRDRIDTIREVQRCYDPDTGETREVSIHDGC